MKRSYTGLALAAIMMMLNMSMGVLHAADEAKKEPVTAVVPSTIKNIENSADRPADIAKKNIAPNTASPGAPKAKAEVIDITAVTADKIITMLGAPITGKVDEFKKAIADGAKITMSSRDDLLMLVCSGKTLIYTGLTSEQIASSKNIYETKTPPSPASAEALKAKADPPRKSGS